jgi:hypothetical protein
MQREKPTRRQVVRGLAGAAAVVCCGDHVLDGTATAAAPPERAGDTATIELEPGLSVHPRSEWGADLPPKGQMGREDVKFLLVHHTASSNQVSSARNVIRSVYFFHTGPQKGWNDVAYNFFVAPDGSIWEGRAGSIDGPVVADATGGNQGFSQLVCLIGNHVSVPPTAAAQNSLVRILSHLAIRYELTTWKDASTTFVSRGSNKFPAGSAIMTPIISPHRAVTFTVCPGDAAVALLPTWRRRIHELVAATWEVDGLKRANRTNLVAP